MSPKIIKQKNFNYTKLGWTSHFNLQPRQLNLTTKDKACPYQVTGFLRALQDIRYMQRRRDDKRAKEAGRFQRAIMHLRVGP